VIDNTTIVNKKVHIVRRAVFIDFCQDKGVAPRDSIWIAITALGLNAISTVAPDGTFYERDINDI
jgi:hypothetical protein